MIKITSDSRRQNNWVRGRGNGNISFEAKVFDKPSVYGIDEGRISKLGIKKDNKLIANYDRGWDVRTSNPEYRKIYEVVMAKLNGLDMVHTLDVGSQASNGGQIGRSQVVINDQGGSSSQMVSGSQAGNGVDSSDQQGNGSQMGDGSQKGLLGKLEAAKEKVLEKTALKEFEVTITETLQKKVTVTAKDQCEAEEIVEEQWNNGDFIIDADHFAGAKFNAALVKHELSARGEERY